jgi:SecD/SecF fusion protein
VLEVDRADLVNERLQNLLQDSRRVLRDNGIDVAGVRRSGDAITVTLRDPAQRGAAVDQLENLANPVGLGTAVGRRT